MPFKVDKNYKSIVNDFDHGNFKTMQGSINTLPEELMLEIFSYLNLTALGKVCRIGKEWKRLTNEPTLWKNVIYREIAFGNDKWARCFGTDVVKNEDGREDFSSLPMNDFIEDCKKFKSLFPEKSAKETLMLVRLPKTLNGGLTLKSLGELAKKYFPRVLTDIKHTGYGFIGSAIFEELGDKPIDKSRWVLMTKDVLPGSRNKSYAEQQQIVAELVGKSLMSYEVPETLESAACILSQYFDSKTRLFSDNPLTDTRCKDNVTGYQTIVGNFEPCGLFVCSNHLHYDDDNLGVAALRKL